MALLGFMAKEFLPALLKAGLEVIDFWSTAAGRVRNSSSVPQPKIWRRSSGSWPLKNGVPCE
jgi:hypothetical protein